MLFDTHAHYDDEAFDPDRELLLESLPQRGVARSEERRVGKECRL